MVKYQPFTTSNYYVKENNNPHNIKNSIIYNVITLISIHILNNARVFVVSTIIF